MHVCVCDKSTYLNPSRIAKKQEDIHPNSSEWIAGLHEGIFYITKTYVATLSD